MNVYLAGKVGHTDYRHSLVQGLRNWEWKLGVEDAENSIVEKGIVPQWPVWENAIFERHGYAGPYFVSCDHGCWHNDNDHGTLGGGCAGEPSNRPSLEAQVLERCKTAIQSSDVVFAWIDDPTCYGTIAELGYAHALSKKIYIAGPRKIPDLWFVYGMAKHVTIAEQHIAPNDYIGFSTEAYEHIHNTFIAEYLHWILDGVTHRDYINSDKWRTIANAAKDRAGHRCQVCNRPRGQVTLDAHHRTYERLGWELPDDITVLCRSCHELYESNKRASRAASTMQPAKRNRHKR